MTDCDPWGIEGVVEQDLAIWAHCAGCVVKCTGATFLETVVGWVPWVNCLGISAAETKAAVKGCRRVAAGLGKPGARERAMEIDLFG